MDSELGGAQVRLESGTFPWLGMGVGTSAIRRDIYNNGGISLIGKAVVLKTTSNHLRRGVSVRVGVPPH